MSAKRTNHYTVVDNNGLPRFSGKSKKRMIKEARKMVEYGIKMPPRVPMPLHLYRVVYTKVMTLEL